MGFLERLENLIQSAVEGGTASVLRNKLKPVEIETHLQRAMRDNAQSSHGGRIAPSTYTVWLHPDTYRETIAGVEGYNRHCEMLLNQYASQNNYTLLHHRLCVAFEADSDLGRRDVSVHTSFASPAAVSIPQRGPQTQLSQNDTRTQIFSPTPTVAPWALRVVRGVDQGRRINVPEGESRIGRSGESDIVLNDDRNTVSRQHAVLTVSGNEIRLRDVGSKNGTKVNGNYIPSHLETLVAVGAELTFGECMVRVEHR